MNAIESLVNQTLAAMDSTSGYRPKHAVREARRILDMRASGCTYREICQTVGVSGGTIKNVLREARRMRALGKRMD